MKIFLSFLQSQKKHPIPAYDFWQYYLKNGIEEAGHQWDEHPDVDWALGLVPQSSDDRKKWKGEAWSKTVEWLKANPADLFLSYLYPEQIDVSALSEIKKMGIICVNFYCDNIRQFKKIPQEFGIFDLNWVPEYGAMKMYRKAGFSYINLPMPMWIAPKARLPRKENIDQITFIGSKDIQRQLFFESFIAKAPKINLAIYGKGWVYDKQSETEITSFSFFEKINNQYQFILENGLTSYARKIRQRNFQPPISDLLQSKLRGLIDFETYNNLTAGSKITIGINRYPSFSRAITNPASYSRLRDIEAPMLGACYLTEKTEGIELLYEPGEEVCLYSNEGDLINKIEQLGKDAELRNKLRLNGQKRALNDHGIPQSLKKIVNQLK